MGRLSSICTTSPVWNLLCSSCAAYFFECVTNFLYTGCITRRSTRTITVLSQVSLTTIPCKTRFDIRCSSTTLYDDARPTLSLCGRYRDVPAALDWYSQAGRLHAESAG